MINFTDTLLTLIFLPLVWALFSLLCLLHIRLEAKKKWKKNEETYPYFHYPFYKKIFLVGLKGALDITIVVATFIFNISTAIFIILGVWHLISPNIYISYCLRAVAGVYGLSWFLKLVFYATCPPKF